MQVHADRRRAEVGCCVAVDHTQGGRLPSSSDGKEVAVSLLDQVVIDQVLRGRSHRRGSMIGGRVCRVHDAEGRILLQDLKDGPVRPCAG